MRKKKLCGSVFIFYLVVKMTRRVLKLGLLHLTTTLFEKKVNYLQSPTYSSCALDTFFPFSEYDHFFSIFSLPFKLNFKLHKFFFVKREEDFILSYSYFFDMTP